MNNGHEDLLANKDGIVGIFFSSTKSNDRIILPWKEKDTQSVHYLT